MIYKNFRYGILTGILLLIIVVYTRSGASNDAGDFVLDFPRYMGWTIDSIIHDIGFQPIDSEVIKLVDISSGDITYTGCGFRYPNGVFLSLHFDRVIRQLGDKAEIVREVDYFMNENVNVKNADIDCDVIDSLKMR